MRSPRAFTFIEMLVLLALALGVLTVLEVAASGSRRTARQMQNNTQLRGIHQAMIIYAQGNGLYYPGLDRRGEDADPSVENRLHVLLMNNYFTGEYAISPSETKTTWTTGPVTTEHYSYAMLQLPDSGARRSEWRETLNTEAVMMADRNTGTDTRPTSVHGAFQRRGWACGSHEAPWAGSVVYNDNHVVFEFTHRLPTMYRADDPARYPADDLYRPEGDDDAWLVYSGNGESAAAAPPPSSEEAR